MRRPYAVRVASAWRSAFLWAWILAACGHRTGGASNSNDLDGDDTSTATGSDDSGTVSGDDAPGLSDALPGRDGTTDANGGGMSDGGAPTSDGGMPDAGGMPISDGSTAFDQISVPTDDGGSPGRDIGSCCSTQSTPGCSNPDLEVCVCQKDSTCCTTAWSAPCVLFVRDKFCQPSVRDCVCGTDAGQWGQTDCCTADWTSMCDSVATLKCNAPQGCF
jgi:hypothetical protein